MRCGSTAFRTNNGYLLKTDMENDLKNDPSGNKRVWYAMLQNAVQDYYIGDLYKDQWAASVSAAAGGQGVAARNTRRPARCAPRWCCPNEKQ